MGNLYDWGSTGDTADYGYLYWVESSLRVDHPEWVPVDKYGVMRQGGPIEFAYPQARQAVKDVFVNHAVAAGYDGVFF